MWLGSVCVAVEVQLQHACGEVSQCAGREAAHCSDELSMRYLARQVSVKHSAVRLHSPQRTSQILWGNSAVLVSLECLHTKALAMAKPRTQDPFDFSCHLQAFVEEVPGSRSALASTNKSSLPIMLTEGERPLTNRNRRNNSKKVSA